MQKWVSFTVCRTRPALWENPSGSVAYEIVPNLPIPSSVSEALVEGVSEPTSCGVRRLVGWEPSSPEGIVWDRCLDDATLSEWCAHSIEFLIANPVVTLRQAFDLNQSGHVVVLMEGWSDSCTAQKTIGDTSHSSDLDFDLSVGASDLAVLLGAWSATTPCELARADVTADALVDASDLSVLLGDWSSRALPPWPCSGVGCQENIIAAHGEAGLDTATLLQLLGFGSIPDFVAWSMEATDTQMEALGQYVLAVSQHEEEES